MSETSLETRLTALPPKVGIPFTALLQSGLIADSHMAVILDAGDLAGNSQKLLAFAVSYLSLTIKLVPVSDVIAMAKSQGRRVNLGWSEKRWRAEHDRLSRAETLKRLAGDNITYDLADYDQHLPDRFTGYLIRSSKRLGMEGLRQRHCVASYHTHIATGRCAIAAVFVGKTRWTVEIIKTGDSDYPLRIGQIKSRFNKLCDQAVRTDIHEILGIEVKARPAEPPLLNHYYRYKENLRRVLRVLRDHRIMEVRVNFDGSGDSGSIDSIDFNLGNFNPNGITVDCLWHERDFQNGQWILTPSTKTFPLTEAVDELTYDYLQYAGVDWYNDEGGFGELVINVAEGTVNLEIEVRYTRSECEFLETLDIETGEAL